MLQALQTQHAIPVHQDMRGFSGYGGLASRQGYDLNRNLHVASNGNVIELN